MADGTKQPEGRPTKYSTDYADQAYKLALLGATDKDLADFFNVCEATINNWKLQHPSFLESIHAGKTKADAQVAEKLFDRAIGAKWTQEQAFKVKETGYDEKGRKWEKETIEVVPVTCGAPPETQAISLWLRNRQSGKWKDKVDHDHTVRTAEPAQDDEEILAIYTSGLHAEADKA